MSSQTERPLPPPLPTADKIPTGMPADSGWVCWKAEWDDEKQKWKKPPHSPRDGTGKGAVEKNESHFTSFDRAIAACADFKLDGVGRVFREGEEFEVNGEKLHLYGVDLDHCVVNGVMLPEIKGWLKWFPSYTEISPSGTGIHVVCLSSIKKTVTPRPFGTDGVQVEMYYTDRYFTFTGQRIGDCAELKKCDAGIKKLIESLGLLAQGPGGSEFPPIPKSTALRRHQENLEALRDSIPGERNSKLNHAAWYAGMVHAAGVLDETAESIREELLTIITRITGKARPDNKDRGVILSAWGSGVESPLEIREDSGVERKTAEFNAKYSVIQDYGGKCRIVWFKDDDHPAFKGRQYLASQSYEEFNKAHNDRVEVVEDGETVEKRFVPIWFYSENLRKEYSEVVFQPERQTPGCLNLWQDFAFKPRKGDCSLYLTHVKENVCANDSIKYDYLIGWMAYAVQHPGEQGHTAIAVTGEKGVGKNVFAESFMKLYGRHGLLVSDSNKLTSNFNAHLRDKCVLVADEAFFAGDKKHGKILNNLITGSTLNIEAKGVDSVSAPNFLHIIILGNDRWLVPVTKDERRYLYLECSSAKIGDKRYFKAILDQLKDGGYEALLYHLLHDVDLSNFEVRDAPHTKDMKGVMRLGAEDPEKMIYHLLSSGKIPSRVVEDETRKKGEELTVRFTLSDIVDYAKDVMKMSYIIDEDVARVLRKIGIERDANTTVDKQLKLGEDGQPIKTKSRKWHAVPLHEFREKFVKAYHYGEWLDDGEEGWEVQIIDHGHWISE